MTGGRGGEIGTGEGRWGRGWRTPEFAGRRFRWWSGSPPRVVRAGQVRAEVRGIDRPRRAANRAHTHVHLGTKGVWRDLQGGKAVRRGGGIV